MTTKDTGGPAFPTENGGPIGDTWRYEGMTLRDYFAAKALSGWLASFGPRGFPQNLGELAKFAYEIADAMLRARETA